MALQLERACNLFHTDEMHTEEAVALSVRSTVKIGATGGCAQLKFVRPVSCQYICRAHNNMFPCARVHFERLIFPWTDAALGNCSYLDTCRHMKTCRYVHYQLDDQPDVMTSEAAGSAAKPKAAVPSYLAVSTC